METTKKVSLYKINEEQMALMYELEAMEGELTPEMEEALIINKGQLKQKGIAYLEVIKGKKGRVFIAKERLKDVQALIKREEKVIANLESALLTAIKIHGDFEADLVSFGTRKSTTVDIFDAEIVPKKFYNVKTTTTIDKARIKIALNGGEKVKGAKLVDHKNLKIK